MAAFRVVKKRIIIWIVAAVFLCTAAIGVMWYCGLFLPGFVKWNEKSEIINVDGTDITLKLSGRRLSADIALGDAPAGPADGRKIWSSEKKYKVQDFLVSDIDGDKRPELMLLCWKIGKYGHRKPFWVKHDELKWSQHIYIYEIKQDDIKPQWMASDIGVLVQNWEIINERFLRITSVDGKSSTWTWISWGLERIPDEVVGSAFESREKSEGDEPDDSRDMKPDDPQDKKPEDMQEDTQKDTQEDSQEDTSVEIVMVGDVLLHDGVVESCKIDGEYDFRPLFANTKEKIESADIAIVNQEVILGGQELGITGYPSFNAPYEVADALIDAGFDVICHATNHALDRGAKGIVNCLEYWNNTYPEIDVVGIYDNREDFDNICIRQVNGIRFAILDYTYGTNGIPLPGDMPYAVKYMDESLMKKELDYAEENADFTIVCPHWGIEYHLEENRQQEEMAVWLVENGADLILGTHPHVIEPVEWIEADNGKRGLCYYSLGNFINWTSGRGESVANRMIGGMADVCVDMEDEEAIVTGYDIIPLVSHVEHTRGRVTTYFLDDYSGELAEANAISEQDNNFSLDYCKELIESVWGSVKNKSLN